MLQNANLEMYIVGNHVTLVAHSRSVGVCLDAAKELEAIGVECEVGRNHLVLGLLV